MSAKITKQDVVFLAKLPELFDGLGWHKLGTPTDDFTAGNIKQALFVHRMEAAGVMVNGQFVAGDDFYAVANDTGLPVGGAVGRVFRTPDNALLYKFFCEAIAETGYEVCSVGTLDNRAEFFVDAKSQLKTVAGREVTPYFGLNRMFGGKGSVVGAGHQTVMQCGNTTQLFRSQAYASDDTGTLKNTLAIFDRLPAFKETIKQSKAIELQFDLAMEQAALFKVKKDVARLAFVGFIATGEKLVTRSINRANRLLQLFKDGKGNDGRNAADWFNSITDYFTHESAGAPENANDTESLAKQWYASEFGSGRNIKTDLATNLFSGGKFNVDRFTGYRDAGKALVAKAGAEELALLN